MRSDIYDPDDVRDHISPTLEAWRPPIEPGLDLKELSLMAPQRSVQFNYPRTQFGGCESCDLRGIDCPGGERCEPCVRGGLPCFTDTHKYGRPDGPFPPHSHWQSEVDPSASRSFLSDNDEELTATNPKTLRLQVLEEPPAEKIGADDDLAPNGLDSPRPDTSGGQTPLPSLAAALGDINQLKSSYHAGRERIRSPNPDFPQSLPRLPSMHSYHASPPISPSETFRRDPLSPNHSLASSVTSPRHGFYPQPNGHQPYDYPSSSAEPPTSDPSTAIISERMSIEGLTSQSGSYVCNFDGCTAPPFQTQYLLNSHANVHSSARPHYCPVHGCARSEAGKGFKRKNEMIRHGLVHDSPGYVCPFCPDREHKYPRPENLQRHVRVHHVDKDKDDPLLRDVLAQRPDGPSRGRRRRGGTHPGETLNSQYSVSVTTKPESRDRFEHSPVVNAANPGSTRQEHDRDAGVARAVKQELATNVPDPNYQMLNPMVSRLDTESDFVILGNWPDLHSNFRLEEYTAPTPHMPRPSSGLWTGVDDFKLLALRATSKNWNQIQQEGFPSKTGNACRKRHELLVERAQDEAKSDCSPASSPDIDPETSRPIMSFDSYRSPTPPPPSPTDARADDYTLLRSHSPGRVAGKSDILGLLCEGGFTDSGYESAPPLACNMALDNPDHTVPESRNLHLDNDDARTVISAATVSIPSAAQQSISEVCNAIYGKVQQYVDQANRALFFEVLPELLKAFAIRLAQSEPIDLNLRIMHFVYNHHQEVVAQMKHILCNDKEEDMATRKLGGMSIQEKMLMWETSPLERRQEPVVSEYFEGVDDMDDHAGHPDFSTYSQTILNSKAYTWLVDSLLKESSFHWDDSKPKIMINNIRHEILNALPTGKISRKQSPCIYRAAFHIPWLAPMKRLERERTKNRTGTGEALGNIIVLTSSSEDQTQATRVEEYMTRTWSSGSSEILQVLKDAVGRKDYSFASAFLRDKTEIKAVLKRSTLVVEVAGPRRSIAECGEQLAWLTTALQDSNEEIATHHAPLLINQDVTHLPLGTQAPESCWKIEVAHRGRENVPNIAPLIATGWLGGRIKPVIARGFPTTRRPLGFSGVELSPKVLVSILCATESRWELVKKADGICLWHVLPSHEERCGCATISQPRFSTDIHDYRHIIDNCPKVHPSSGSSQLRPLQAVPDPNAPSHSREGLVVSPMASKGIFNAPTRVSLTESPATSMDPDMMSIPDSPEEFSLDPSGILLIVVRATARQLLDQYRTETSKASSKSDHGKSPPTTDGEPSDGTNSQGPSSNESYQNGGSSSTRSNVAGQSTDSSSQESAGPNLKRTRRDEDNEEDGDDKDRDRMPPPKKPKRGHDLPSGKTLACPFWKLDPNRHRDCLRREKFVQISRIKQHLARKHTPIYCERCKLILPNEDGHRKHHEQPGPGCVLKEWDPQHGISHQQQAVLHKKSRADLSTPEQWFAIWNLLFPEHARPSSPYIDQGLSDDFCNFREYVQQRGTQALVAQLQGQGISAPTSEPAMVSYLERVVSTGLDALIEDWLAMRMAPERSPNGNRNQDDHPRSETSDRETTGGSQTDSGVVLSSLTDLSSLNLAPQDGNMPTADMMPRFGELGVENYHLIGNHMPISDFHIPDSFGDMGLGGTWPGNFGDDMNFDAQLEDYLWDAFRDPTEDHQ